MIIDGLRCEWLNFGPIFFERFLGLCKEELLSSSFRESHCLSFKFVVYVSIRSSVERSLSTLFDVDGCIGGREEDWGVILWGGDTTLRAMGVPCGDDDEVLGVEGGRSVLLSSYDVVSDIVLVERLSTEGKCISCMPLHIIASFIRSDLTDSST